jgi:redox-sensing transcriptional repressor
VSARKKKRRSSAYAVSEFTPARLSIYLRCLNDLEKSGANTTSSRALAERYGLNAAQIRKDLAYFGAFGVRGVGYYIADLKTHLRGILGLDRPLRVAIVGAGNLGRALADYQGFHQAGFQIVALFDNDPERVGRQSRGGVVIRHANEFQSVAKAGEIDVAVVAVPGPAAQAVVDAIVRSGVKAILNFSPGTLKVPAGVKVKNVEFTISLESLSFFLAQAENHGSAQT